MALIIYIIFFLSWFIINYRKQGFNISTYIIFLYLFSMVCGASIFVFYPELIAYPSRITFLSVSVHVLLLWLYLYPLSIIGNKLRVSRIHINANALKIFSWFIIIPSIISIVLSVSKLQETLLYGNFLTARTDILAVNESSQLIQKYGMMGYTIAWGEYSILLSLTLALYYIFALKKRSVTSILLFASSFAGVLSNISLTGRASVIKWLLSALFGIILMRDYISFKKNKLFWILSATGAVSLIFVFFIISGDRFSDVGKSLLNYSGEEYYYFSYSFNRFSEDPIGKLSNMFPIISGDNVGSGMNLNNSINADYFLNTFSTFVGSFIMTAGLWKTLALFIFVFCSIIFIYTKCIKNGNMTFTMFIGYIYLYEVALYGLFYYYHGQRFAQGLVIIYLIVSYALSRYYADRELMLSRSSFHKKNKQ